MIMSKEKMAELTQMVEAHLPNVLPEKDGFNDVLVDAMAYSLLSGGKRLRPVLALASCAAVGGDIRDALTSACSIECIHAYSLIHDDLPGMDDDELRRGKPTNHIVYGVGMATLAGDGLQTQAFEVVSDDWLAKGQPEIGLKVLNELARGAGNQGMVVGQAQDLLCEGKKIDEITMKYIHAHKTGALIIAAVRIGAIIGGADPVQLEALSRYGMHIGLAFQITDDILDVVGDTAVLGKPVGSDEKNEKATYPSMYGLDESRAMAEEQCQQAHDAIRDLPGDTDVLHYLADYIVKRQK